jgi:ankyrin repeat protein
VQVLVDETRTPLVLGAVCSRIFRHFDSLAKSHCKEQLHQNCSAMHKFYGEGLFRCHIVSCNRHRQGFDTFNKRDCHVAKHFRPFKCPISTCDYNTIGFETEAEENIHHETCHFSGCEIEGSWDEMDENLSFRLLCSAAATGDVTLVKTLSSQFARKAFDVDFENLLDSAVEGGSQTVLEFILSWFQAKHVGRYFLLELGVRVLHRAIIGGHESIFPVLVRGLSAGKERNVLEGTSTRRYKHVQLKDGTARNLPAGLRALHLAVIVQSEPMVVSLLDAGVIVDSRVYAKKSEHPYRFYTPLHLAAEYGSASIVQRLIQQGADIEVSAEGRRRALTLAVKNRNLEAMRVLIEKGADVDYAHEKGLLEAMKSGDEEIVRLLLSNGAKIESRDDEGNTALDYAHEKGLLEAMKSGDEEIVRLLLSNGAKIESRDDEGNTALHLASSEDTILSLIESGADIEARNKQGQTPLLTALMEGKEHKVWIFLGKGASTECMDVPGVMALHHAFAANFTDTTILALIDGGANIEARDKRAWTPLLAAIAYVHREVVRQLLSKGANTEAMDDEARTALHFAAIFNSSETIISALIDDGANIEARDKRAWTPLLAAIAYGHDEIVRQLLRKGANTEAIDAEGRTALHLAIILECGSPETIVQALLDGGANIEARNKRGQTPLHAAKENGQDAMVKLLLEAEGNRLMESFGEG